MVPAMFFVKGMFSNMLLYKGDLYSLEHIGNNLRSFVQDMNKQSLLFTLYKSENVFMGVSNRLLNG